MRITSHTCLVPNCQHLLKDQPVSYYIYTNPFSDVGVINEEELDKALSSLEHTSRLHTENDFLETIYFNETDFDKLKKQEKTELIKLSFCKYHAPSLATFINDKTKTKLDILGQSTEINDDLRKMIVDWNDNHQKIKSLFDGSLPKEKNRFVSQFQDLDLSYFVFPSIIDLSSLDTSLEGHSRRLLLKGCYFEKKTNFSKTSVDNLIINKSRFIKEADFWMFVGRVGAEFKQCLFYDKANFRGAKFKGNPTYFDETIFYERTQFEAVDFENQISFQNCLFKESCDFRYSSFTSTAVFNGAEFKTADFSRAFFKDSAHFESKTKDNITKIKFAFFRNTWFSRGALFDGVEFGKADFIDSIFSGSVSFKEISVKETAFFDFTGNADDYFGNYYGDKYKDWPEGDFFNWISFEGSIFLGAASFQNRIFRHTTSFKNVSFKSTPRFEGANLHPNTDFFQTQFNDKSSANAIRSYRYLKRQMEKVGAKTEESLFFALEQHATLNLYGSHPVIWKNKGNTGNPDLIHLLLLVIYKWTADFGRSPLRTIGCITLSLFMSAGIYNFFFYPDKTYSQSLLWGIKTVLKPFSTLSEANNLGLGLLTSFYGIIQIILLIMLGFAIRRRMGTK